MQSHQALGPVHVRVHRLYSSTSCRCPGSHPRRCLDQFRHCRRCPGRGVR